MLVLLLSLTLLCGFAEAKRRVNSKHSFIALKPSHASLLLQNVMIDQMGLERIGDEHRISYLVETGYLQALPITDAVKIAPSIPSSRRYALPMVNSFLVKLASEYYAEFHQPLLVDSATRDRETQRKLLKHNHSAAPVDGETASSHETGATIDLSRRMTKRQTTWLEWRLAYYSYARRLLIVEEEKHCFHIFVMREIKDAYNSGTEVLEQGK